MLQPKKMKHRKWHKGRRRKREFSSRGTEIAFGTFALKAMAVKWISAAQIEAARKAIGRELKKKGKLWIRIFPAKPVTSKGGEVGMGGGKGAVDHYVFPIAPGRIIFELDGVDEATAREAFKKAADKLPIKTKFITKEH